MAPVFRTMFYDLLIAFVAVFGSWWAIFIYALCLLNQSMPDESFEVILMISLATVLPLFYVQIIIVQFCLTVNMICLKVDKVNEVLKALCDEEVANGNYELGCY